MSDEVTDSVPNGSTDSSDSRDCVDIVCDAPGDTTVRPCRPELLPYLLAARERLQRWEAQMKQQSDPNQPPDMPGPTNASKG